MLYTFAVQLGLYFPLLLIVYPVGHDVVYVHVPGVDVAFNEQLAPPVAAQFLHHFAVNVFSPDSPAGITCSNFVLEL